MPPLGLKRFHFRSDGSRRWTTRMRAFGALTGGQREHGLALSPLVRCRNFPFVMLRAGFAVICAPTHGILFGVPSPPAQFQKRTPNSMLKRTFVFAFVLLMAASACVAQSTPSPVTLRFPDRGFSSYSSLSQSYDSSANWTSIVDSTVSYNFNKVFGISVGAPFYLASNQPLFAF